MSRHGEEVEAAYFTLLRAREELANLRRYDEYLAVEARRLRRSRSEGRALHDEVDRRLLRGIQHTDQPLDEAVDARLGAIEDEHSRLPDRIAAAESFVEACEREHDELRSRR